jgi:hypothetical protein
MTSAKGPHLKTLSQNRFSGLRRFGIGLGLLLLSFSAPSAGIADPSTLPAAPTNLSVSLIGQRDLALDWQDNSDNETEFRIEQKTLNGTFVDISAGDSGALIDTFRVRAHNAAGYSAYSNEATASTFTGTLPCNPGPTTLCVQNERFLVRTFWRLGQGSYIAGNTVQMTSDTGYFWFFDPANVEMVVKVLDGCTVNGHHWVFAGGLTDVHVVWTVTDTNSGFVTTYVNPAGAAFVPVQDTRLRALCP